MEGLQYAIYEHYVVELKRMCLELLVYYGPQFQGRMGSWTRCELESVRQFCSLGDVPFLREQYFWTGANASRFIMEAGG